MALKEVGTQNVPRGNFVKGGEAPTPNHWFRMPGWRFIQCRINWNPLRGIERIPLSGEPHLPLLLPALFVDRKAQIASNLPRRALETS